MAPIRGIAKLLKELIKNMLGLKMEIIGKLVFKFDFFF